VARQGGGELLLPSVVLRTTAELRFLNQPDQRVTRCRNKRWWVAAHESPRTTKLYNRTGDEITLDEVERIGILE